MQVVPAKKRAKAAPPNSPNQQDSVDWATHGYVRVAAVAPPVHLADPRANAVEVAHWAHRASDDGASLVVFPELALTGYTCEDLFLGSELTRATEQGIIDLAAATADVVATLVVGVPLQLADGRRVNTAIVLQRGCVVGAVPKLHLPNNGEFYERRWFTPGADVDSLMHIGSLPAFRVCADQLFGLRANALFGIEICEDLWSPQPPSARLALAGALVIVNPSASNELVAKSDYRRELLRQQSARTITAYVYAGCGPSESTKDLVFGGHVVVAENGSILAEGERFVFSGTVAYADIDLDSLANDRSRNITWSTAAAVEALATGAPSPIFDIVGSPVEVAMPLLRRRLNPTPFVPDDATTLDARAAEILAIQSTGLARRIMAARSRKAVIGVSGGLDSTLALLVTVEAMRRLGRTASDIVGITMPGLGTTMRTRSAADELMKRLGTEARTIPIAAAVAQHFTDIGHDPADHSVVFENAQARERTQILFDVANQVGGIVVGTGDLSELALGWCTYNADHMANYSVNASVPKTLVRHLVRWYANTTADAATSALLVAIADTPVSPELLPPGKGGEIVQMTEDVIGPYELHDFFLWQLLRNGFSIAKIRALAGLAFVGAYDQPTIDRWLRTFVERFYRQQFKRTTLPPGPKVGSVSVSPRGDLRMPDEVDPASQLAW